MSVFLLSFSLFICLVVALGFHDFLYARQRASQRNLPMIETRSDIDDPLVHL